MSFVIEQAVEARLVAAAPRMPTIPAALHYDARDPFAVRMAFPAASTLEDVDVAWTFGRELLATGVERSAGQGDVRVRPYGYDRTVLEFHAPEGTAIIHVHTTEIRRFLKRAGDVVPPGHEHLYLDMDQDLAELMGDAC